MNSTFVKVVQNTDTNQSILIQTDHHNTLHLKLVSQSQAPQQIFYSALQEIQAKQKIDSSKAIWIHLNSANLCYIQHLLERNYIIHRGVKDSVSLYKWTSEHKDNIPQFSRFYVGCGAVIIKDNHIFLVQQKSGDRKGFFGLPGGRADPGQFISQATQRQLFEETGLKGKFEYILYFRQLEKSLWGSSDLYFVSLVTVKQEQFANLKLQQTQISGYRWVPLSQYEKFISQHGFGSQIHVSKHIAQLYQKGYDFKNKSNLSIEKLYIPTKKEIMVEHIITGVNLLEKKNL